MQPSADPTAMRLNALVVQRKEILDCGSVDQNYGALDEMPLGSLVESEPFSDAPSLESGVHLHWLLPECFTAGQQQPDGSTQYPPVPNRFVVTRLAKFDGQPLQCRQWLVTSDSVAEHCTAKSPSVPLPTEDGFSVGYLGKVEPYPSNADTPMTFPRPLTAVMPGDPSFAAYYPAARNVFGMYDDLSDLPEGASVGYLVCGWLDSQPIATRCAGQVWGLHWGESAKTESNAEGAVQFAAGETTAEAMEALYQNRILRPLVEGCLPVSGDLGEAREMEYTLHRNGFDPHEGESRYILEDGTEKAAQWGEKVSRLNRQIEKEHSLNAVCNSLREQVYLYWQLETQNVYSFFPEEHPWFSQPFEKTKRRLQRFIAHWERAKQKRQTQEQELLAALQQNGINYKKVMGESYWTPVDPVVLVKDSGCLNAPEHRQRTAVLHSSATNADGEPLPDNVVSPPEMQDTFLPLLRQVADALEQGLPNVDPPAPWSPLYLEWQVWFRHLPMQNEKRPLQGWTLQGLDLAPDTEQPVTSIPLQGRIALSGHGGQSLSRALGQRSAYTNDQRLLQTARQAEELDLLSQRLSGFHLPFLSQKSSLLFPPFDTGQRKEYAKEIAALVGNCNTAAPDTGGSLYWIRAGGYELERLRLVDAYSRIWDFVQKPLHIPQRFTPPDWLNAELLAPFRLVQPSRLVAEWRTATDQRRTPLPQPSESPVFGWVVPCLADRSLLLYCPDGQLAGMLRSFTGESQSSVYWQDAPGLNGSLLPLHDQLQAFVQRMTTPQNGSSPTDPLQELLDCMAATAGEGLHPPDPHTALYEGRMFALAKCSLRLELLGAVAPPLQKEQPKRCATKGEYPVRLGDVEHPLDGLCGFFDLEKDGYKRLHTAYASTDGTYTCKDTDVLLRFGFQWKEIAVLFDPFCPFHIISGFLPVVTCQLAPELVQAGQNKLLSAMQVAPILSPSAPTPPHLPLDEQEKMVWTWQQRLAFNRWSEPCIPSAATQNAWESSDPQHLHEGWLLLAENPTVEAEKEPPGSPKPSP